MIQSVKVTNHLGESITLELRNPDTSGFFIRGIDGLGPPKAFINSTDVLSIDGSIFNSARIGSRNIVLDLGFVWSPYETIEDVRLKSYKYFPMKKPLTLEITTDTRVGVVTGYVEDNPPKIFSKQESTVISIICPKAYFESTELVDTLFSGIEGSFEFPFSNESTSTPLISFGEIVINTRQTVVYDADANTGFVINVHFLGAVNDLVIYDITHGGYMGIDSTKLAAIVGTDFAAGDDLYISTVKGEKRVWVYRGANIYNVLNALTAGSTWFELTSGDNVFDYTADSGLTNMQFNIQHRLLYEGI